MCNIPDIFREMNNVDSGWHVFEILGVDKIKLLTLVEKVIGYYEKLKRLLNLGKLI